MCHSFSVALDETNDINDTSVLSPAHFLYPYTQINTLTNLVPPIPESGQAFPSTWTILQETLDDYWYRWHREYLSTLIKKTKWETSRKDYEIGDIVLIVDQILPRERWRLCRIAEISPSIDNCQRRFILEDSFKNCFEPMVLTVRKLEMEVSHESGHLQTLQFQCRWVDSICCCHVV